MHDEWFADEECVRKVVGLPEKCIELPNDREVFPCFINFTLSLVFQLPNHVCSL